MNLNLQSSLENGSEQEVEITVRYGVDWTVEACT